VDPRDRRLRDPLEQVDGLGVEVPPFAQVLTPGLAQVVAGAEAASRSSQHHAAHRFVEGELLEMAT
jgi:hypothetical protein